jgi:tetratricopeptide (TPR) repeat protein
VKKTEIDILERNVSTLLEHGGGEPPALSAESRVRIKRELVEKFAARPATDQPVGRSASRPLIAVGVGIAALAAAALLFVRGSSPSSTAKSPELALTALADGTTYVADRGGRVEVLGPRRVRVTGAVLFDVVPGKGQFVVETARGTIEVLGTKFVVDGESDETQAAVLRGEVRLASSAGDVMLHAGEQGVASAGKVPVRAPAPRLSHLVSWAREARHAGDAPVHHGTLFARDPGIRSHPPWGEEYPLPLAQLTLDVVVEDQVARVALDQTFHNDQPQDLEGVYRFAIPADAALQRLAMYVDGQLEEAAVVERMQARRIYEELVYRRVDPALLEWAGTGRLALRIYPIAASSDKRLVLAYTQSLPKLYDDYTLTIPLPETDQPVGRLDASVRVKGCANCELASPSHAIDVERRGDDAIVHYHRDNDKLGDSFVLHVRDPRRAPVLTAKTDGADRYVMVRARPALARTQIAYRPHTWVILDDVSASRDAQALHAQRDLIESLVRELDENDRVAVVAFDVAARTIVPPTRVTDIDRRALRTALDREGGVGATDFDVGLAAALAQLGAATADDASIIYLGDGMITAGPRNLDALRERLANRAQFVGVGVGDGPDTQTLGALAAATGGYATTIDLADDLSWRALDLVAALHTARVTGLTARLLDASGNAIAATAYLGAPQLADGEELELVAKLDHGATPAFVELDGLQAGAAWHQRIELAPPREDAGYLPRLWAQRHIAARLLAKHEPVALAPCDRGPCPSEADAREARDEQIRREVVALGKRYFLLSRHTSLLVLENDAMYAQYGVTKGAGDTWAPYALPAHVGAIAIGTGANAAQTTGNTIALSNGQTNIDAAAADLSRGPIPDEDVRRERIGELDVRGGFDLTAALQNRAHDQSLNNPLGTPMQLDEGKMGKREAVEPGLRLQLGDTPVDRDEDLFGGESGGYGVIGTGAFGHGAGGGGGRGTTRAGRWYDRHVAPGIAGDLTGLVPALFDDDVDALRARLPAGSGSIDAAAAALLDRARAATASGVYRWGDRELAIDDKHALAWRRTTDSDLVELAAFDVGGWTRRYPELGVSATRALGDADVAVALAAAPLWIPDSSHFAKYFDVTANGRDVTLSANKRAMFVLSFDAQAHLLGIRDANGSELVSIAWAAGGMGPTAARVRGEAIDVGFSPQPIGDAAAWAFAGTQAGVVAMLPAHPIAFWQHRLASELAGAAAWRDDERQLLVAAAATHDVGEGRVAFEALRTHGGIELGDVALASGALASSSDLATELGPFATQPIGTAIAQRRSMAPTSIVAPGALAALVQARAAIDALYANHPELAIAAATSFAGRAPALRVAIARASMYFGAKPEVVAALWEAAATGRLANTARESAVAQLVSWGHYAAAADEVGKLVDALDLTAPAPASLAQYQWLFQQSGRGDAGWQLVYARWRDKVLAGDSYDHVIALLPAANGRNGGDLDAALGKATALAAGDPSRVATVARLANQYGRHEWAERAIEPVLAAHPTRALEQVAAQTAMLAARPADALAHLERAQDLAGDEPAALEEVRGELATIIELAQQLALAATGSERDRRIAEAMHWGERWRAIDPGNVQTDRMLGELLLAVGDRDGAWRQLSSAIERDPWSGTGYSIVAESFEKQGKLDDALPFWQQAIVIDQTNPTPRLRKAQALLALGRTKDADELLREIAGRTWHDAWSSVVAQARELEHR